MTNLPEHLLEREVALAGRAELLEVAGARGEAPGREEVLLQGAVLVEDPVTVTKKQKNNNLKNTRNTASMLHVHKSTSHIQYIPFFSCYHYHCYY